MFGRPDGICEYICKEYISARYIFLHWITRQNDIKLPVEIARVIIEKSATNIAADRYKITAVNNHNDTIVSIFESGKPLFTQLINNCDIFSRSDYIERVKRYFCALITGDIIGTIDAYFDQYINVYIRHLSLGPIFNNYYTWKFINLIDKYCEDPRPDSDNPVIRKMVITSFVCGEFSISKFIKEYNSVSFYDVKLWDLVWLILLGNNRNKIFIHQASRDAFMQQMLKFKQYGSELDCQTLPLEIIYEDLGKLAAFMLMLQWYVGIDVSQPEMYTDELYNIYCIYHAYGANSIPSRIIPPRRDLWEWAMQKI